MKLEFYGTGEWHTVNGLSGLFADEQPDPDFAIGDVVSLIVGGPDMVVIAACECGTVEVAWAKNDGDIMVDVFPAEALIDV